MLLNSMDVWSVRIFVQDLYISFMLIMLLWFVFGSYCAILVFWTTTALVRRFL